MVELPNEVKLLLMLEAIRLEIYALRIATLMGVGSSTENVSEGLASIKNLEEVSRALSERGGVRGVAGDGSDS